jgi:hypothetical protein
MDVKVKPDDDEPTENRKVNVLILGGGIRSISPQKHSFVGNVTSSFGALSLEFSSGPHSLELSTLLLLPHFHSGEPFRL